MFNRCVWKWCDLTADFSGPGGLRVTFAQRRLRGHRYWANGSGFGGRLSKEVVASLQLKSQKASFNIKLFGCSFFWGGGGFPFLVLTDIDSLMCPKVKASHDFTQPQHQQQQQQRSEQPSKMEIPSCWNQGEMDSFDDTAMLRLDRNCRIAERMLCSSGWVFFEGMNLNPCFSQRP